MKVMIIVTHLLGSGHLSRAATLARAFQTAGHNTTLVSGGGPAPHICLGDLSVVHLMPIRSDGTNFSRLLDMTGAPVTDKLRRHRSQQLTNVLENLRPDVLITELYPFGRRNLAEEFLLLLETAQGMARRPLILCSIRDILTPPSKPEKVHRTEEVIHSFYYGVLVHSDPARVPLDISWPVTDPLRARLHYTGFVTPTAPEPKARTVSQPVVLVSGGGGSVGRPVYRTAIAAAARMPEKTWHILVGGIKAADELADLVPLIRSENVILEPARPDFRQLLMSAETSVSMAGYNTVLDLLQTGVPSVLVPFDDGSEVEQTLRARALAQTGGFEVLTASRLTPEALEVAVRSAAISGGPRPITESGMEGARRTVDIVETLAERV
ncbi:MAG: glycosyltransferase [Rhodobacteraceae bacterium]|nr:glycosyltransferase [Paracoccaceae bacterium]